MRPSVIRRPIYFALQNCNLCVLWTICRITADSEKRFPLPHFRVFTFDLSVDIVTLLADLSFVANRWLALRPILTYLSVVTIH